jgi:lysophospholipid acyltransferase (LPLAT)-like uncharacterized protein
MLKKWKRFNGLKNKILPFLAATIGKGLIRLLLWTCRWEVKGLEQFKAIAAKERCILMLWHNRLAIAPPVLYQLAPQFIYSALVSNSRDGELISAVIHSYKIGRTIRVSHHARHQALREIIRHLEEKKGVIIMTPDGPRGPRYKVKPGIALAAIQTSAHVIPFTWTSNRFWEFPTWDQLKLPKPFSQIEVCFQDPVVFDKSSAIELEEAQKVLEKALRF